jgi:hypothetical protein
MSGRAFMLVTPDDTKFLASIEKLIGTTIPEIALDGFTVSTAAAADEPAPAKSTRSRRPTARSARDAAPALPEPRAARPEPKSRRAAEPPRRWRQEDEPEELEGVVGFGSHVPAFLRTPPRVRRT